MKHREKLLEAVIVGLLREIKEAVDDGTKDHKQSINIELDWSKENVVAVRATAYPIKRLDNGFLQEDCTGQEELFLDITTKGE